MPTIDRKLASVRKIKSIEPIPKADRIVKATVDGWELVTQSSNNFKPNDLVCYFECDSLLPIEERFDFLEPYRKTMDGVDGYRLKTIKLKSQISQGLILPLSDVMDDPSTAQEGDDLTEKLGVRKWEKPEPSQGGMNSGRSRGNFPDFVPKTDQNRAQNCLEGIKNWIFMTEPVVNEVTDIRLLEGLNAGLVKNTLDSYYFKSGEMWFRSHRIRNDWDTCLARSLFEVTLKLDGSSVTIYHNDGRYGVCSRNLELKRDQGDSAFWKATIDSSVLEFMVRDGRNVAIQGELMGPGIQGNRESHSVPHIFIFDVYDIDKRRYFTPDERYEYVEQILNLDHVCIQTAPTIDVRFQMTEGTDIAQLLKMADRKSIFHDVAEGLVFKSLVEGGPSFKIINNKVLLDEE